MPKYIVVDENTCKCKNKHVNGNCQIYESLSLGRRVDKWDRCVPGTSVVPEVFYYSPEGDWVRYYILTKLVVGIRVFLILFSITLYRCEYSI